MVKSRSFFIKKRKKIEKNSGKSKKSLKIFPRKNKGLRVIFNFFQKKCLTVKVKYALWCVFSNKGSDLKSS